MTISNGEFFPNCSIDVLHIKTPIFARIPISKDKLTVSTNYPSVPKDQALEETVLTLFYPVVDGCLKLVGITIEDTIACHDVVKG